MKKKIDFPKMGNVEIVNNNDFILQWCCSCHARHIWHYRVIRGKIPTEDQIEISGLRDITAEKMRKAITNA